MAYLIYMDSKSNNQSVKQLETRVFEITGLDGKTTGKVKAKSIWTAYEAAVLTGDILVFESLKGGN